jgi:hypothetical protein
LPETVTTPAESIDDTDFQELDDAIDLGHIVTQRGSSNINDSIEAIVLLSQALNVQINDLNNEDILEYLNAASFLNVPKSYNEAMNSNEKKEWEEAMKREMVSINDAGTWILKEKPNGSVKLVKSGWVFTKKLDKFGDVKKYKARLVAKGYSQTKGIDYNETYAPVVKFKSVHILAALCAKYKLKAFQDDVPTAFLKGNLKEEIYMHQTEGFKSKNERELCYLQKTLYGLKQSPREWNEVIHKFLIECGFIQSLADPCIYVNSQEKFKGRIFVGVYVDDIKTIGNIEHTDPFRAHLWKEFGITDGGPLEWYLGVSFHQLDDGSMILNQSTYLKQKLQEFREYIGKERRSNPIPSDFQRLLKDAEKEELSTDNFPYRKIIGSLMYAMLCTRPDLAVAVSVLCQHLDKPRATHIKLVKHLLQYVIEIQRVYLFFSKVNRG